MVRLRATFVNFEKCLQVECYAFCGRLILTEMSTKLVFKQSSQWAVWNLVVDCHTNCFICEDLDVGFESSGWEAVLDILTP